MNNFDCTVSLGYNCYPCMYEEKKTGIISKSNFFDDIATPMWAIKELLVNDFNGFFDATKYEKMKVFDESNFEFLTNKQYYIRFTAQYQTNKLDSVFASFKQRQNNFVNKLRSDKKILFIRYEEPMESDIPKFSGKRIIRSEFADKYQQDELYYLNDLSTYLKATYPNLNFHIMFISNTSNPERKLDYNKDSKIITIPNKNINTGNYEQVFDQIFAEHGEFINSNITT